MKDKIGLYLFLILGLIFWLSYSPVYRFAIHLFLTLIFILFVKKLMSKNFSKNIFLFFFFFYFFSFSKNIIRLNKSETIFLGVQKIDNKYIMTQVKYQSIG